MLCEKFDVIKEIYGSDQFENKIIKEIVENLNPAFNLRYYQKEAIGRFIFYLNEYPQREKPVHLLFHMATGSGKTLLMAAGIIYLYLKGYRNFIFFVNSTNIIEKTRNNFLNSFSNKYLFSSKIKFEEKEILIREVENFEAINSDDINIIFTTIQGLHSRINEPRENSLTYEDFDEKNIVLISDEAHHINTLTKIKKEKQRQLTEDILSEYDISRLNKGETEEFRSWESTVQRILNRNKNNILLEYTATVDLYNENIKDKYEDKIIYKYDLKQFRKDGFSKEIEVLQADLKPIDRALQAILLSQYRRKIAEKSKIYLKPVILFKSNYVNPPRIRTGKDVVVSGEFKENFNNKINNLNVSDLVKVKNNATGIIKKLLIILKKIILVWRI